MKVYADLLTSEEFFSDAKTVEEVKWVDPDTKEEIDTGLVRVKAQNQTAGGGSIDVGGGGEFGGAGEEEGVDDSAETKLDQFWSFPGIENEIKFASFAAFKKDYWMPFLITFQKLSVEKKCAIDAADMKEKGKKIANNAGKWLKAHFDEIQFYTLECYYRGGDEVDDKYKDLTFASNIAFVRYEGSTPYFYFVKDAFIEKKF